MNSDKPTDEALVEVVARLRMIVSHATGGNLQYDPAMSVNGICVEISRMRNEVFSHGKEVGAREAIRKREELAPSPAPSFVLLAPCPPHAWVHAPTVGYISCHKCGARHDYKTAEYKAYIEAISAPSPAPVGVEPVAYCNKCGYFGPVDQNGTHARPKDGSPCHYQAFPARGTSTEAITAARAQRDAEIVAWLRGQADKGIDMAVSAAVGSTRRAAYGGGSLALTEAADAIERGEVSHG